MPDKDLSPCPFCGCAAKVERTEVIVRCGNYSGCAAHPSVRSNSEENAVAMWESRGSFIPSTMDPRCEKHKRDGQHGIPDKLWAYCGVCKETAVYCNE